MARRRTVSLTLVFAIALIKDVFAAELSSSANLWDHSERAGLQVNQQRLISVPIDPGTHNGDNFDLYYFINPARNLPARKTILFCAGGPGELITPDNAGLALANSLTKSGYNIVYFHLRGAGFSQIPRSNEFDKFLTTENAAADIEEIRKDLAKHNVLGESGKWDAIVGYSYGSVLAQVYASRFGMVDKVVLAGAISMHDFRSNQNAFDEYSSAVREVRRKIIDTIFSRLKVNERDRTELTSKLFGNSGIFKQIEEKFGNEEFIINNFCDERTRQALVNTGDLGNYSLRFFQELRNLRRYGLNVYKPDTAGLEKLQNDIGKVIATQLVPTLSDRFDIEIPSVTDVCSRKESVPRQYSYRNLYAMRIFDGLLPRFLKEWQASGKSDIRSALIRSGGSAGVNPFVEKVGISFDQRIEAWDPKEYGHAIPTLLINGSADPVSAGGQARHYFDNALSGPRVLIELAGVGHEYRLPTLKLKSPVLTGTIVVKRSTIPAKRSAWLTGTIDHFGLKLDISPPNGLDRRLKWEKAGWDESTGTVSIRFTNTHSRETVADAPRDWHASDAIFTGTVRLNPPALHPGKSKVVSGRLEKLRVNKAQFKLQIPMSLRSGVRVRQFGVPDNWNTITFQVANNLADSIPIADSRWPYVAEGIDAACQGVEVRTLDCLIFAFTELEFPDFVYGKVEIFEEITAKQVFKVDAEFTY